MNRILSIITADQSNIDLISTHGPQCQKICLWRFANNKGADQPVHPCSLISAFIIHFLESIISKLATSEIRDFLASLCS